MNQPVNIALALLLSAIALFATTPVRAASPGFELSFLEFFHEGDKAALGKPQKAVGPKDNHVVGFAVSLPLRSSWKLRAEALQSSQERGENPDNALDLKLAGKLLDLDVEANVQSVGERFRSAGGPALRPGNRANLRVSRKAEAWQVSANAAISEPASPGALASSSYGIAAERRLPGDWRSSVRLERVEQPRQEKTTTALALRRRFARLQLGIQHREIQTESAAKARATQSTSVDLRFQQKRGFSLAGGTSFEQRRQDNLETLIHKLFVAPGWTSADDQLRFKLRLGLDLEEHALDRERRRVVGQTSVVWKVRDGSQHADLSFDLSVRTVEDWLRSALDRRAGLKLTYRLGRAH